MRRVAIVDNTGSGKSHLAKELARATGLPSIHLDNEFWKPGWEKARRFAGIFRRTL